MGKKKPFINKKNSATFHLLSRDSAAPAVAGGVPASDRVFVRVDSNPYSIRGLEDDEEISDGEANEEFGQDSIFADAPEDADDKKDWIFGGGGRGEARGALPDHVRKEIIELGMPDDGYNYLLHLREIKNSGGGSTYYHNSKAKLDRMPLDVKVTPQRYSDHDMHFVVYWTADGGQNTGCYNLMCEGFVLEKSSKYIPGSHIRKLSTYNGDQYEMTFKISKS